MNTLLSMYNIVKICHRIFKKIIKFVFRVTLSNLKLNVSVII